MERSLIILAHGWPSVDNGYGLAALSSLTAYASRYHDIQCVGLTEKGPTLDIISSFPDVKFVHLPVTRKSLLWRFLSSILSNQPACIHQFKSRNLIKKILNIVEHPQKKYGVNPVVIFEGIPVAFFQSDLKRANPEIITVIRSHEVLTEAFSDFSKQGNLLKRIAWKFEVLKIGRFEKYVLKKSSVSWAITSRDRLNYKNIYNIDVDGVMGVFLVLPDNNKLQSKSTKAIISIGTIDYRKEGGLHKFIQEAWPIIKSKSPECRLILGGINTERYDNRESGISGLGFISDIEQFLEKGYIFLNSQHIGSGIKLKSLVAMAWGKLLVTTSVGVQGIDGVHGEHFLCCDKSENLAELIIEVLENPQDKKVIAENSRAFVEKYYSRESFLESSLPLLDRFGP